MRVLTNSPWLATALARMVSPAVASAESIIQILICRFLRTLVGAGLKDKADLRRPLASLVPSHIAHVRDNVKTFEPKSSSVTLASGRTIGYDILVVATGLRINWEGIKGLSQALAHPTSGVSSIYSYDTCDKAWKDIDALRNGKAIFTQPAGVIKCAGGQCPVILWYLS